MMKKTIALLAIVVITGVVMFSGCVEDEVPSTDISINVISSNELNVTSCVIVKSSSSYYRIKGTIKNEGAATAKSSKILIRLYDDNNSLIGSDYTYADISDLQPNEESTFSTLINIIAVDRPCVACELNVTKR